MNENAKRKFVDTSIDTFQNFILTFKLKQRTKFAEFGLCYF